MTIDLGNPRVLGPEDADRQVLLADPRGYCAGVDRAVVTVEEALDLYGAPVYVRKQIVHNKHVVSNLEKRGAIFVEELDEVPRGRDRRLLRPRRLAGRPRRGRRARAQDHRRHLPAGDQGPPRGDALRPRGLHHPADRPRRPRGGRGHRRGGARADGPGRAPRRRRHPGVPGRRQAGLALADHAERRRDDGDRTPAAGEVPPARGPAQRRHLLRHPEPSGRRQGDRRAPPTW